MKVTLISAFYPQKSISVYSDHLTRSLAANDLPLELVNFKNLYPEWLYPGGAIDEERKNCRYDSGNCVEKRILAWYNPFSWLDAALTATGDIIHLQWWTHILFPVYFTILLVNRFTKKRPAILTLHNVTPHEQRGLGAILTGVLVRMCDKIIVHNEQNKSQAISLYRIKTDDVAVIPIGVYDSQLPPITGSRAEIMDKLALDPSKTYCLFFGSIRPYKGLDVLLKAWSQVIKNDPSSRLIIAGTVWGSWDIYQGIIDELDLAPYIVKKLYYIPAEEIARLLTVADVVVLPYRRFDASSGLVKTALALTRPMVVTAVGDLAEIIGDRRFIARPGDSGDLAGKLSFALSDKTACLELTRKLNEYKEKYSWSRAAAAHRRLYDTLI